jgi:hypothetical protein
MRTFIMVAAVGLAADSALGQTMPTDPSASPTMPTDRSNYPTEALNPSYNAPNGSVPDYQVPDYQAPDLNVNVRDEAQAKSRIEAKGYLNVSGLQKDDRGIWRGQAILKDGRPVTVVLDLQGNIYSELSGADNQQTISRFDAPSTMLNDSSAPPAGLGAALGRYASLLKAISIGLRSG